MAHREKPLADTIRRIAAYGFRAPTTMQLSRSGEQQLHMVGNFRHGRHGRTGRPDRVYLIDRNCRWNADDPVHSRLVHPLQELAYVRREGLDVTSLSLGVQRVEGETGFAGSAHTGHDGELAERYAQIDTPKVVLRRSFDYYVIASHDQLFEGILTFGGRQRFLGQARGKKGFT